MKLTDLKDKKNPLVQPCALWHYKIIFLCVISSSKAFLVVECMPS